jgi:hypothetical protein
MSATIVIALVLVLVARLVKGYIYYPLAPNALYQEAMNVSFVSGRVLFFNEVAGYGADGSYNGALGIVFDRTEKYAFVTSADGKKLRKLNIRTTQVGEDISSKFKIVF